VTAWANSNSLAEAESLLSKDDYQIRIGVVSLLESARTPLATKLLRRVAVGDQSEAVRKEAREALARIQKPKRGRGMNKLFHHRKEASLAVRHSCQTSKPAVEVSNSV